MPIFQYRFGNGLQKLKRLVDAGLTGETIFTTIETSWLRGATITQCHGAASGQPKMGGVCLTQAIHSHDMLSYINGTGPSGLRQSRTRVNPIEVEDCAAISVEMADGSLATLSATLGSTVQVSRLRFCFRNLTAESNLDPYRPLPRSLGLQGGTPEIQAEIDAELARFVPGEEFFVDQFVRLHRALTAGGEWPVTLAEARASLES